MFCPTKAKHGTTIGILACEPQRSVCCYSKKYAEMFLSKTIRIFDGRHFEKRFVKCKQFTIRGRGPFPCFLAPWNRPLRHKETAKKLCTLTGHWKKNIFSLFRETKINCFVTKFGGWRWFGWQKNDLKKVFANSSKLGTVTCKMLENWLLLCKKNIILFSRLRLRLFSYLVVIHLVGSCVSKNNPEGENLHNLGCHLSNLDYLKKLILQYAKAASIMYFKINGVFGDSVALCFFYKKNLSYAPTSHCWGDDLTVDRSEHLVGPLWSARFITTLWVDLTLFSSARAECALFCILKNGKG
jgi:hypothetical protein